MVDVMDPSVTIKAILEFQTQSMIMSWRVACLWQSELADEEKKKKELTVVKKKSEADKTEWMAEKKNGERGKNT